jgi:hypothetical protein
MAGETTVDCSHESYDVSDHGPVPPVDPDTERRLREETAKEAKDKGF